ncbi:amidohydrolase family protein [Bradyrhizobium ontarionense]|uniref:Amidohydrolase family protein n=1 Tax=Bradyrhizobium ontarionense TaxID=2898149 RepID=A0ABY3R7M3_9BRAD|nr:amidohydrolase family protein [Bradyrhizobium sp. A19]UFZ02763.1 amidohydrolase family protein [Bradyrhizobium sp. A19]
MSKYDLVICRGRVIDPETNFNGIADVAIKDGKIAIVGDGLEAGEDTIDAQGLIVSPGFIDIHAHGQSIPADRMQAFDGVTTALELELGVLPVGRWYAEQAHMGRVLNYGASVGWVFGRIATMTAQQVAPGLEGMGRATGDRRWIDNVASPEELDDILDRVDTGLREGGLGIGFPNGYAPGTGMKELSQLCELAAHSGVPTFTHIAYMSNVDPRSSIDAYTRLIGLAGSTGAHMHICHFNSTSLHDVERAARLVSTAQLQGLKVTVEAYPYGTGSTVVSAEFFSDRDFAARMGSDYGSIELLVDRRRLRNREDLVDCQSKDPGALVLLHFLDVAVNPWHRDLLDIAVMFPGGAIASDAMPWTLANGTTYTGDEWPLPADATSHPRSSGTFSKFLREWVHERREMSLIDGIRKCSLIPAQILEPGTPQMRTKGRVQPGCDADLVVFDLNRLSDRADFHHMNAPSQGVAHLLVNGESVISDGELSLAARPGRPVRRRLER